ncbi:MAG: hypothetical protein A3K19_03055 [Lentisphaerae bacterium RIFOXYB12_FULL_65_16]|nr:MAG: hypothetical protein A3K18_23540 [Lentisphaerae bacterium RIFOXYA12_64_32]OGV92106.1 MAG: hypothetical protein A3K19_03055 [Lentisphaerae bacterium RIFOXYB12_FULL_65_16]
MVRHIRPAAARVCLGWALTLTLAVAAQAQSPVSLGTQRELFVDEFLIGKMTDARLVLHAPTPREVVIVHDAPWEGNTCCYHTVFRDGDVYRMYYRGSHSPDTASSKSIPAHPEYTCYAESPDGIHWTRPELGQVEFNGSRQNNILAVDTTHNFAPFRDANPNATPDARYKAIGGGPLFAFKSPDGLHWSKLVDKPVITKGAFDSQNLAFWDVIRGRYVDFHRHFKAGVRDVMTCTSPDFVTWTEPVWLEYPGVSPEHLYTNQIVAYQRAPHIFMGFPKRFMPDRQVAGNRMPGLSDGVFMTSRDGVSFKRWPEAFIRPGPNRERWFNRNNMTAWGIVETATDIPGCPTELSLYSTEAYYESEAVRVRRFTLRLDGFVSVQAPMSGGEMVTKPLVFAAPEKPLPPPARSGGPVARTTDGPILGTASLVFNEPAVLTLPGTRELGAKVTFAVQIAGVPPGHRRLFSAYDGGPVTAGVKELVFDIGLTSANAKDPATRFMYSGVLLSATPEKTGNLYDGKPHHLAVTWDDGVVRLYVDGREMGSGGATGGGPLSLALGDLRFGEDYPPASVLNEPFLGKADDILVLRRVLTADEIAQLARDGAAAVVDPARDEGVLYTMEQDQPERTLTDALPKDGNGAIELPRGGPDWGDVQLLVNYSTSVAGSLRCEIQDETGKPIPGFSLAESDLIYGDHIERPISWAGRTELKSLVGKPVKLRFELKDADLYAIRFGQMQELTGR